MFSLSSICIFHSILDYWILDYWILDYWILDYWILNYWILNYWILNYLILDYWILDFHFQRQSGDASVAATETVYQTHSLSALS